MSRLLSIPSITAYHLPTLHSPPIFLARGELVVSLLPSSSSSGEVIAFTITNTNAGNEPPSETTGKPVSFLVKPNTPVVKTETNHEHPSYLFAPALPASPSDTTTSASASISTPPPAKLGKIKLVPPPSHSPTEYTHTEHLCAALETLLKAHNCFQEPGYYDLEDLENEDIPAGEEGGGVGGYGTVMDAVGYYAGLISHRVSDLAHASQPPTTTNTATTNPATTHPSLTTARHTTSHLSDLTHSAGQTLSHVVHSAGGYVGALAAGVVGVVEGAVAGDANASTSTSTSHTSNANTTTSTTFHTTTNTNTTNAQPETIELQPHQSNSTAATTAAATAARNFGTAAGEVWDDVTFVAVDTVERVGEAAQSLSQSAHRGIEQRYGTEADKVAQDIGQTGTNLASVGMDGMMATSVLKHGYDVSTGAVEGYTQASNAGKQ